mmetsp:Transcript_6125/g.15892  ORF Transcript_6125/g.15892 Transcript_6125/m.15892 type:complete len:410 (-) Transcript_6125:37-1266(-)
MDQMKNMTGDDWKRMQEQMSSMTPEQMQQASASMGQQAGNAGGQMEARQQYELNASKTLKADANKLFSAGKLQEALEKYDRVKENLKYHNAVESIDLRKSCLLNASLCNLKLKNYDKTVQDCNEVLKSDVNNVKAVYRRGQAHEEKGELKRAAADIKRATELSPSDEVISAAYDKIKAKLESDGVTEEEIETVRNEAEAADKREAEKASSIPAGMGEMLDNPEMMKMMTEQMKNMSPDQLDAMNKMAKAQGMEMPEITPEMASMVSKQFENMSSEEMAEMMKMSSEMQKGMKDGKPDGDMMKKMSEQMKDPKMQKMMGDMMKNLTPEQLKEMSKTQGMDMSDEQAEQTAAMMRNVKPEHMQKLMAVAGYAQTAYGYYQKVRDYLLANKMILYAIIFLFVALLARWFRIL